MYRGRVVLIDLLVYLNFWSSFISLIGRVSSFWIEGGRRARRRGGDLIFNFL